MNTVATKLANNKYEKYYFYWKNKVRTIYYDFSKEITEEEFINKYLNGNKKLYEKLKNWGNTKYYADVKKVYYAENAENDFIKMFEAVREKALKGDNASVKTFLMLQKMLKKDLKKNENKNEDDGLTIS